VTTFEQRIRDAKTILQARWPDKFPLNEIEQNIVATIMVDYAIQCERQRFIEHDEELHRKIAYFEQCLAAFREGP